MKRIIVGGSNSKGLAKSIARKLHTEYSELYADHFPDGETRIRFKTEIKNAYVVLVNSLLPHPNESMIELIFAIHTAKELGAKKVIVVAPYLAYMRQDKRFHEGECISSHVMAKLLSCADHVVAIDPHLHRIKKLSDIFDTRATSLTAYQIIAKYIHKTHPTAIIIGPDGESSQWAKTIAESIGQESVILSKKRWSATKIHTIIHGDPAKIRGRDVVIVDDIVSTGHTMIEPIKQLKKFGVKRISCICVHGVFSFNALQKLRKLGVQVLSTNTIENPVAKIDVTPLIVDALENQ